MNDISIPRHPIRVVAQRTGLTPVTIRAWERRYEAVRPIRSGGGQRLYSDQDVERLKTLRELTAAGRAISTVAGLSHEAAEALVQEDRAAASAAGASIPGSGPAALVDEAFRRVGALDAAGLERTLWHAVMRLGARAFMDEVVAILLDRIGTGWLAGKISPAQEHLASDVIDHVLERLADRAGSPGGATLVLATLPGERHGLGARLASVAARLEGWKVAYLGTDLPVVHIASAAEELGAGAVAISVVGRNEPHRALSSLIALREALPAGIEVLVGGRGSRLLDDRRLPSGVTVVETLDRLCERLRTGPRG